MTKFCEMFDPNCLYGLSGVLLAFAFVFLWLIHLSWRRKQRASLRASIPMLKAYGDKTANSGTGRHLPDFLKPIDPSKDGLSKIEYLREFGQDGALSARAAWHEDLWMLSQLAAGCLIAGAAWLVGGLSRHMFLTNPRSQALSVFNAVSLILQGLGFGLFTSSKMSVAVRLAGIISSLEDGHEHAHRVMDRDRRKLLLLTGFVTFAITVCSSAVAVIVLVAKLPLASKTTYYEVYELVGCFFFLQCVLMTYTAILLLRRLFLLKGAVRGMGKSLFDKATRARTVAILTIILLLVLRAVDAFLIAAAFAFTPDSAGSGHPSAATLRLERDEEKVFYYQEWIFTLLVILGEPVAGYIGYQWAVRTPITEPAG